MFKKMPGFFSSDDGSLDSKRLIQLAFIILTVLAIPVLLTAAGAAEEAAVAAYSGKTTELVSTDITGSQFVNENWSFDLPFPKTGDMWHSIQARIPCSGEELFPRTIFS